MDDILKLVLVFVAVMNVMALILTVFDKSKAKQGRERISEKNLITVAVCGGAPLMYITMLIIRHKTKHKLFMIGLPVIILIETAILFFLKFRGII